MRTSWLPALAYGGCGVTVAGFALALLLLPQQLALRPMQQGVLHLQVQADGSLRLWNQPVSESHLRALVRGASARPGWQRLRLVPDPGAPWGQVLRLIDLLDDRGLPLELQLPSA
jgi:biopolymer transport protein ExbD